MLKYNKVLFAPYSGHKSMASRGEVWEYFQYEYPKKKASALRKGPSNQTKPEQG